MKLGRGILFFTFILIVVFIPSPLLWAQENPEQITTDRPVYPVWGTGGVVMVNATNLASNETYYLWLQRPSETSPRLYGDRLTVRNGTLATPIPITVSPTDPAGTYTLTLSTSDDVDTKRAIAHFGVFGTSAKSYERTQTIVIAGGGFLANASVSLVLRSGNTTLSGFPITVPTRAMGDFNHTYRLPPSTPAGPANMTVTGQAFDGRLPTRADTQIDVKPTSVTIKVTKAPPTTAERTTEVSVQYQMTYPDDSPVTTAASATVAKVVSDDGTVAEVPIVLTDPASGTWRAAWTPLASTNVGQYHFELPARFDDSYGNLGRVQPIVSSQFRVVPARVDPIFVADATIERTEELTIIVVAQYYNGTGFANVTRTFLKITRPDGTEFSIPVAFNYIHCFDSNTCARALTARVKIPVNATLGRWVVRVEIEDIYENTAVGNILVDIVRAVLRFDVNLPSTVERTTAINVTTRVTYPDGTIVTTGVNGTVSFGNFTWSLNMTLDTVSLRWSGSYLIPQNATLGPYNITLIALDPDGNEGILSALATVKPATLAILLPSEEVKAESGRIIDVPVLVTYPNGTALSNVVGLVSASYSNSSGVQVVPLVFNATEGQWHLYFRAPNIGLSLGVTVTFTFAANDVWGNAGLAKDAFQVKVGTDTTTLIIAGIVGIIPPIGLLTWAIATIATKRRKFKPEPTQTRLL